LSPFLASLRMCLLLSYSFCCSLIPFYPFLVFLPPSPYGIKIFQFSLFSYFSEPRSRNEAVNGRSPRPLCIICPPHYSFFPPFELFLPSSAFSDLSKPFHPRFYSSIAFLLAQSFLASRNFLQFSPNIVDIPGSRHPISVTFPDPGLDRP
jgi:hypothetical protein